MNSDIKKASCKHLTYKHSPFWGCTVQEAVVIFAMLFGAAFIASTIVSLFLGMWFLWFLVFLIIAFCGIKFILKWVGSVKQGKQHGFLLLKIQKVMFESLNIKSKKFVAGIGIWSKRRSVK